MAICHRMEIRVYDRYGAGTPVTVPAYDIKASLGLGGVGFLSFSVDARAEPLASDPDLLDDCVIKVALPLSEPGTSLTEVAAYANRGRAGILWDGAGARIRTVNAASLFTVWSQDAVLHPEGNTITQMAADQRYFGWMSSIYDPADDAARWGTPSANAGQQDSTTGARAGNPDGWPTELGNAYWITRGTVAYGTRHLFVADCVVPTDCYLTVYHSSDESTAVYYGGSLVLQTSSSETGYQQVHTWSAWVTAGTYRVGIDKTSVVSRGGDGRDPVLLAVATNTDTGEVDQILLLTNTTDWQVCTLDPITGEPPSLTPGAIVTELHSQAVARGVNTWAALTLGFDADVDSDGLAWPVREERAWRIAYDRHLDMIEGLGDLGLACEITPGLVLEGWSRRGTDRSGTVTLHTPPTTTAEIAKVSEQGTGVTATYLPVETQDGWVTVENPTAAAAYGRRESALSLGNAPSTAQGARLGQQVLDQRLARPETEWPITFYARAGAVPFSSFGLGDTVTVDIAGTGTPRMVLDLGWSAAHTEAIIEWTAKMGDTTTPARFTTQPGVAVADGGVGSLVGDLGGGAAVFSATGAGSATASGEVGSLIGFVGGVAIFSTVTGSAAATGSAGNLTGAAVFATTAAAATADGGVGSLVGDPASATFSATGGGNATADGGVGSLVGAGGGGWESAAIAYDWTDWVKAYSADAQGDMADDASTHVASEVWQ